MTNTEDRARSGGRRNLRRTPARIDFTPEMLTQDMGRRPRHARSATRTVRMRFLVGTIRE